VAVPVYGGEPLSRAATQRLLRAAPTAERRTEAEVREVLKDALGIEALERMFDDAVEGRRQALVAERRSMKAQMAGREGARTAEWLQGIDDLSPGSFDLLALTIFYPS